MTRDNSKNRRYTKEEKGKLIRRMLPPESIFPSKLLVETGISKSTLATWENILMILVILLDSFFSHSWY